MTASEKEDLLRRVRTVPNMFAARSAAVAIGILVGVIEDLIQDREWGHEVYRLSVEQEEELKGIAEER